MTSRQVGRVNQQSKGETHEVSGVLQRAAVRAVADKEGDAAQEVESGGLRESRFVHDFTQVPNDRGSFPKEVSETPNQTGLPDNLKAGVENLSGYSLDEVRVHYNSPKPAEVQAKAYAQGTEIHVAAGQEKHLPHEAWHVVQQMQERVKPTIQMKGREMNDEEGLEREAERKGEEIRKQGVDVDWNSTREKGQSVQRATQLKKKEGKKTIQLSGGSSRAEEELRKAMGKAGQRISEKNQPKAKPHTKKGTGSSGTDHQARNAYAINTAKQKQRWDDEAPTMFQSSQMRTYEKSAEKEMNAQEKRKEKDREKKGLSDEDKAAEMQVEWEDYKKDLKSYRAMWKELHPEEE